MKIGIGAITFSSPTFCFLPDSAAWAAAPEKPRTALPAPLHPVLPWRTPLHQGSRAVGRGALQCAPKNALPHSWTLSLKDHVPALKLWETTLDSPTGAAGSRALRLCFLGTRAALSGQAVQLEHPCSAAAPSRDSLEQTPPVASPAVLPPLQGGHRQEQHPFLGISISICWASNIPCRNGQVMEFPV